MKAKLVSIGNSKGIRLPASLIKQYGLDDEVELDVLKDGIVIRPRLGARKGWEASFDKMHEEKDDLLLDEVNLSKEWDESEWTW